MEKLRARERGLFDRAPEDLPALAIAEDAGASLGAVIEAVDVQPAEAKRDPTEIRRHALWFMAIIGFRALRAAIQVLRAGYEDQALGYQRLLDETHNRAQKVRADQSGGYAREWLAGRPLGKGAKLAGQEFWELMSGPAHANVRAVLDWLAIPEQDGTTRIVVGPERRPEVANATFTYLAGAGRDLASMLALEAGVTLDLSDLDARIAAAQRDYIPEETEISTP